MRRIVRFCQLSSVAPQARLCSAVSGVPPAAKAKVVLPRRKRLSEDPLEDDVMPAEDTEGAAVDESAGGKFPTATRGTPKSVKEKVAAAPLYTFREAAASSKNATEEDGEDDDDGDDDGTGDLRRRGAAASSGSKTIEAGGGAPPEDAPLTAIRAPLDGAGDGVEVDEVPPPVDSRYYAYTMPDLIESVCAYLRTTENPRLVDADEEMHLFSVLRYRFSEASVQQLLQVVGSNWARSTLARYGTEFKDQVRDHIAAKAGELSPEEIFDSLITMGMSAGRRKRDLDFFQLMGNLLAGNINSYKDPHQLVQVLTAFSRAKIMPPDSFLSLISRRLPVLNKKTPLRALPAYRAFVNLKKMGHEQLNSFRFLADRILECVQENLKKELIAKKLSREGAALRSTKKNTNSRDAEGGVAAAGETADCTIDETHLAAIRVKARFFALTELKPSQLTKLLFILSWSGAPHQQYLRPLIKAVIVPALSYFPPPSISRLIRSMTKFGTTDRELITAVIDDLLRRCEAVESSGGQVIVQDILEILRLLSLPDTPMVANSIPFMKLVERVCEGDVRLRPSDMCAIGTDLMLLRRKKDDDAIVENGNAEATDEFVGTLSSVVVHFAKRMTHLMDLGVLSLTHADILEDMIRVLKLSDPTGAIQGLREARRRVNQEMGDDEYYMQIDVDVRETFHKMLIVNNYNTHNNYKPLPGLLQVDFKQALTEVSAETILAASHLFEQAFPDNMSLALQRALSRAFLRKVGDEGEEVLTEDRLELVLRPAEPLLFSKDGLQRFANLLKATPLTRVKANALPWELMLEKAVRLQVPKVEKIAADALLDIKTKKLAK